jgi:antitoxin ParD1/3/4
MIGCTQEYNSPMEIRLRPELAELVKQDIERGPYKSVDEFVEEAVSMLHEREAWLTQNRSEIAAKIEEGFAASQRGELIDADTARATIAEQKRAHFDDSRR